MHTNFISYIICLELALKATSATAAPTSARSSANSEALPRFLPFKKRPARGLDDFKAATRKPEALNHFEDEMPSAPSLSQAAWLQLKDA